MMTTTATAMMITVYYSVYHASIPENEVAYHATPGVALNRKNLQATWAHKKKNLRAQLHIHGPNIMHEISIFISIPRLNAPYHFHFAEKRCTAGL